MPMAAPRELEIGLAQSSHVSYFIFHNHQDIGSFFISLWAPQNPPKAGLHRLLTNLAFAQIKWRLNMQSWSLRKGFRTRSIIDSSFCRAPRPW